MLCHTFPSTRPLAAYVDTKMPGMRPMLDSSRNVRMRMSVNGTRYVKMSFGMPGMRNSTNTMSSSLPDFSKRSNLSIHFSDTMSFTNGAPKRCTTMNTNALDKMLPSKMTRPPIQGP